MRIFQAITVSEYGGAQSVVANLCRELSKDHEVFLIYAGQGQAWKGLDPSIKRLRYGKHRKEISWKDFFLFLRLLYYRFRYRPDIIHLHSSKMGAIGRMAFPGKKVVYTVHGFDSMRVAFRKFLFVERILAPGTGRIVGVSNYDLQGMKEENIKGKLDVVYNGIDDYRKEDKPALNENLVNELRAIRGKQGRIVMCIARISKQKNFPLFVDTAKQLPRVAFVWIGNENPVEDLPENVYCLGSVEHAYRYLDYADIFILPSHYEGLPISIIEAMCFSKPALASGVGGVSELIREGISGYTLPNNADEFAGHIKRLLENEAMLDGFGKQARRDYEDQFTIRPMVEGYKRIYSEL